VTLGKLEADQPQVARNGHTATTDKLGMTVEPITGESAQRYGVDDSQGGVLVTRVNPSSLAARAGIRPGDIIISVDGTRIMSPSDFSNAIQNHGEKRGIRFQIMRSGVKQFVFLRGLSE
jgi:serine protease Do